MGRTHTTEDFFTLEVFSSMYLDWGLSVNHALHGQLFYNPSALGRESCGTKPNPEKYEDWDEAERAALDGDDDAFVPWTVSEWSEWLADEADELLDDRSQPVGPPSQSQKSHHGPRGNKHGDGTYFGPRQDKSGHQRHEETGDHSTA